MIGLKEHPKEKPGLHSRNKHRERYNFTELIDSCPELAPFVSINKYNDESVDFANAEAVLTLNKAILKHFYGIDNWTIPPGYLCPPVPGRADYIHHMASLLGSCNQGKIPTGKKVKCLDIGVGANCIYPIIGHKEYGWSFVGSEIEPAAIQSAIRIIEANVFLKNAVELRFQPDSMAVFSGIIQKNEQFDITICNPPFHASFEEAQAGTLRKLSNLKGKRVNRPTLNFGGHNQELWCEGGEEKFVQRMIAQSRQYSSACFWFSTLVAKQAHLKSIYSILKNAGAAEVKTIQLKHGNKTSRIVAWTWLTRGQQSYWIKTRWNA